MISVGSEPRIQVQWVLPDVVRKSMQLIGPRGPAEGAGLSSHVEEGRARVSQVRFLPVSKHFISDASKCESCCARSSLSRYTTGNQSATGFL